MSYVRDIRMGESCFLVVRVISVEKLFGYFVSLKDDVKMYDVSRTRNGNYLIDHPVHAYYTSF